MGMDSFQLIYFHSFSIKTAMLTPPYLPLPLPQLDYLQSVGLRQDEICNMASISVVLLGLNPETRLRPVVEYLHKRGVPGARINGRF